MKRIEKGMKKEVRRDGKEAEDQNLIICKINQSIEARADRLASQAKIPIRTSVRKEKQLCKKIVYDSGTIERMRVC